MYYSAGIARGESEFTLPGAFTYMLLTLPVWGRGSSTHRVCLCVCYRSNGRCGYLTSEAKVATESSRRNEQNEHRNFAKNV